MELFKSKVDLKNITAYKKPIIPPINFFASYMLIITYILISLVVLASATVLLIIGDGDFIIAGLMCIGVFIILSAVFFLFMPQVKQTTILNEIRRCDLDTKNARSAKFYDYSTDKYSLKFDDVGMLVNGKLYSYDELSKNILTDNHFKRINIYIRFSAQDGQTVTTRLDLKTLKMLEDFDIKLENQAELDYILSNQEAAFTQIYDKGCINDN